MNMSPEEILSNIKENQARIAEDQSKALAVLKDIANHSSRTYLPSEYAKEILLILEHRKSCIMNLTGVIDEYVASYPKDSRPSAGGLFNRMAESTTRYGKVMP